MSETERPGATGDEEHEATEESKPSPDEGPDVDELDEDPAYNPDDPELKGIKGG